MNKNERTKKMQKRNIFIRIFSVILVMLILSIPAYASTNKSKDDSELDLSKIELYPGGMAFGVKVISKGLTIVKFSSTQGSNISSAYQAGMREGDVITKVNGININTIEGFVKEIDKTGGNKITITALRNDKEMTFTLKPKYSQDDGKYKTGIWVKDSTTGIGTVTFIDPNTNAFGGLGHAICDSTNGKIIPISKGLVMNVAINGVLKGSVGSAGELKGTFLTKKIGAITKNCTCGVFGILTNDTLKPTEGKIGVCPKEEVKEGEAYIWCTLDESGPKKYNVCISNVDTSNSNVKNFRVKITDPTLLEKAGGIVQGMSGSPIIQNGRIIGAVTHVLINDPTQGYGIFIENMLNQMQDIAW